MVPDWPKPSPEIKHKVLRHMPFASTRSACLTSSGQPWADSGGPTEHYAIADYAWPISDRTLCSASPATKTPMGDCGPFGGAVEELLGATLYGNAGRRAQAQPGMRAVGRGVSYPAQRDQATLTVDLPRRGP